MVEIPKDPQTMVAVTALSEPRRLAIFLKVGEKPGITPRELSKELKIRRNDIAYGLGILHAGGLVAYIAGEKQNGVRCRLTEGKGAKWHERLLVDAAILGPTLRR
jgi:DNA-binding transcriptional ArsR family regulator